MKTNKYSLLCLYNGSNKSIVEGEFVNSGDAREFFLKLYPEIKLNENGYYKQSEQISYCIAARTEEKYSMTTTKHISKFLSKYGFEIYPSEGEKSPVWTNKSELLEIMNMP